MSYETFWNNTQLQHMAGPTSAVIRLPRYSIRPSSTSVPQSQLRPETSVSHFLQKSQGIFPDLKDLIRPQFCFPFNSSTADDDFAASMAKYCDPRYLASEDQIDQGDAEGGKTNDVARTDIHLTLSSHFQPLASSETSPMLSPVSGRETGESQGTATPRPEDQEGSDTDATTFTNTLSPYAPMPLPPIFSLETETKVHVPIESAPYSLVSSSWFSHGDKVIPIDPALVSNVSRRPAPTQEPFARGSTTSKGLWPPAFSSDPLAPLYRPLCPETVRLSTDVPLDTAMRQAEELRAKNTDVYLPVEFLMTFMGQPEGQPLWHCYIQGCGKQLARKGHMHDHIRMHLNDKMFECEHCPQTFLRKADCKRHSATHNPVKAFNCDSCMKSYGRKDLLTRHIRVCQPDKDHYSGQAMKKKSRKRKGIQDSTLSNKIPPSSSETPGFVNPSMLLMPAFKSADSSWAFGLDDENKENVDPSSWGAIGHISNQDIRGTNVERRKRARTHL